MSAVDAAPASGEPDTASRLVSVLVVARDEPRDRLARLLAALDAQQGPVHLEVLLAVPPEEHSALAGLDAHVGDGMVSSVRLVSNPGGARCTGLNHALSLARGDVVARADARSMPSRDYVARAVARLDTAPDVGVVGGVQRPVCVADGVAARGIARALRNPWLLGGAVYRRPGGGGNADTAYLGVFRTAELRALGGWDERLAANEDFDLCARFRAAGASVWVEPGLEVPYEPRASHRELWRQYHAFGVAKARYWRIAGAGPNQRQVAALAGAAAALGVSALVARQPRRGMALGVGALALLAAADHVVDPEERDVRVRAAAYGAYATYLGAWVAGVARGLVR
ncbi:MAG TPA: glycosyltransferase [Acidimicrobiia bacterium]|nr:glycosyltransferase [Acidimicrobiia bacterium]